MNQKSVKEDEPVVQPAPQLPNFPMSPDDPFQPDIERPEPVTPSPDPAPRPPLPGRANRKRNSVPDVQPQ